MYRFAAILIFVGAVLGCDHVQRTADLEEPTLADRPDTTANSREHPAGVEDAPAEPLNDRDMTARSDPDSSRTEPHDTITSVEPHGAIAPDDSPPGPRIITPFTGVAVNLTDRTVEIDGVACLDVGWLEQIMCTPGTREHESLIVTSVLPSNIHAALLLARYEPGSPGSWSWEDDKIRQTPPNGEKIDVFVRYHDSNNELIEEPIRNWIRDHLGRQEFPNDPWVFGGSKLADNPSQRGGGEFYVADYSGSVIGLVTFGDEVIGWLNVLSDQEAVRPPEWEVNADHVPTPGTEVTVILRPQQH